AAVATAGAAATDVLLQQDDVESGVELLQEPRGPHPRVAAAEDHDVGFRVGVERRTRVPGELGSSERFTEPPAASLVRGQRVHGLGCYRPSGTPPRSPLVRFQPSSRPGWTR